MKRLALSVVLFAFLFSLLSCTPSLWYMKDSPDEYFGEEFELEVTILERDTIPDSEVFLYTIEDGRGIETHLLSHRNYFKKDFLSIESKLIFIGETRKKNYTEMAYKEISYYLINKDLAPSESEKAKKILFIRILRIIFDIVTRGRFSKASEWVDDTLVEFIENQTEEQAEFCKRVFDYIIGALPKAEIVPFLLEK